MKIVTENFPGVRVVRQDPWECLVSFIFSSNNNIKRITKGLQTLRSKHGNYLGSVFLTEITEERAQLNESTAVRMRLSFSAKTPTSPPKTPAVSLFSFPSPETISLVSESEFRELGMGYRAKFMVESTQFILRQGGERWLHELRSGKRLEVQQKLLALSGVGRKVADCVALFSLDQAEAIPVDTHVWDIAVRDYEPSLATAKSLTPRLYEQVGEAFRSRFQLKAGWAHSVLFAAELPAFRQHVPLALQEEMAIFAKKKRQKKVKTND
jgi:N-glycosylase/DNA lyase